MTPKEMNHRDTETQRRKQGPQATNFACNWVGRTLIFSLLSSLCLCASVVHFLDSATFRIHADEPKQAEVKFQDYPFIEPRGYVCCRATSPISIDGNLDKAAWKAVPWTEDFVDIEGDRKPKPRFRTRVKMLWDDDYLYIAAELDEPHVWGTLTQHDSVIFQDNDFEVFIDPDGDNHLYAELELNALNTTWDLLLPMPYRDGGMAVNAWEIHGLKTAVRIAGTLNDPRDTDRGWAVEIAWPWKNLKELTRQAAPPRDGDQWRINFSRVEWDHEVVDGKYRRVKDRKENNWVWSPQGVIDMHRPERWGYLQFSTADPGKAAFRPDPDRHVRHLLHRVYYAQRDFRNAQKRWANTFDELQLAGLPEVKEGLLKLERTSTGFEASLARRSSKESPRWRIRADSKIWQE